MENVISVIVPVYKVEEYLAECVESLINQSYKGEYEIVLVDDGSPDNCGTICDEMAKKHAIVKAYHKPNGGLSDARNYGIQHAKGNMLCFVDSDDFVHRDYLKILYDLKVSTQANISECGHILYHDGDSMAPAEPKKSPRILTPYEWITESGVGEFYSVVAWNKLYDRNLFDQIKFPVGRSFEDEATTYKLVYNSRTVARTYKKLYYYRQRQGSITNGEKSLKALKQQLLALDEKCKYFIDNNEKRIIPFCQAKYCILVISNYRIVNKLYNNPTKQLEFYKDVKDRYKKWIRFSRTTPLKYKAFILKFILTNSLKERDKSYAAK